MSYHLGQSLFSALLVGLLVLSLFIMPAGPAHAAGVVYVVPGGAGAQTGADWANAKDLQAALIAAASGDHLWVKAGTYEPTTGTDRSATFQLKSGVAVYGGFAGTETMLSQRDSSANITILSGDIGSLGDISDNSYHVVTGNGVDATAIIDGLIITAGNGNGDIPNTVGAGMIIVNGSPVVRSVIFSDNTAFSGGGLANSGGDPLIDHVIFTKNTATNTAGGGMLNSVGSPTISYCIFTSNSAGIGGGLFNSANGLIVSHTIFSGNAASLNGGGVFNSVRSATFSQDIFSGNSAPDNQGGGMYNNGGSLMVQNSILWGNTGEQIVVFAGGTSELQSSLVQGGYISGTNILDADPLFVDADGTDNITGTLDDNLRLQVGSPAIDAGNNAFIPADVTDEDGDGNTAEPAPFDLDGKPRVAHGVVDMGAYEWQIITSAAPPSPVTYGGAYNHVFTSAAPGTFSVTAGALPPGLTLTPGGLLSGTLTAAGVYTATVTVSSTLGPDSQTFSIVVNKAPLTITADDKSKIVGTPNPPLTASYSGFVNSDTRASLNGALTITTTATVSSPPGAYPITPGGLSSPNYAITFIGGTLTVTGHRLYLPLVVR